MEMPPEAAFFMLSCGHFAPRCCHVVAELGVADALGSDPMAIEDLAAKVGAHPDALQRMLRLLAAHGVFEQRGGGWAHTTLSEHLREDHPRSLRAFIRMIGNKAMWEATGALMESVKDGKTGIVNALGQSLWEYCEQNPEDGRIFDDAMTAKSHGEIASIKPVVDISGFRTVADIGGGRGHILTALLENAPDTQGILFDLPDVVAAAPDHARIRKAPGSFFTDPLPEAEAYILSNIIHDWDDAEAEQILANVRKAAPRGAKIFLMEEIMPDTPALHTSMIVDIIMLAATGGRERTRGQYERMLDRNGFKMHRIVQTQGPLYVIYGEAM